MAYFPFLLTCWLKFNGFASFVSRRDCWMLTFPGRNQCLCMLTKAGCLLISSQIVNIYLIIKFKVKFANYTVVCIYYMTNKLRSIILARVCLLEASFLARVCLLEASFLARVCKSTTDILGCQMLGKSLMTLTFIFKVNLSEFRYFCNFSHNGRI